MIDPISGALGALVLTGWVASAPTGQDEAYLLLTTDDPRAAVTMPVVVALLGVTGPPGSPVTSPEVYVGVGPDGWLTLHTPGGERMSRPGHPEWHEVAARTGRVVLAVGTAPKPAGMDPDTYTDRHGDSCRIGLVPLRDGQL